MAEGAARLEDDRNSPQQSQDFSPLKTVRYEDAPHGLPPSNVGSPHLSTPPTPNSQEQPSVKRPKTSPSLPPNFRAASFPTELKRDSGIQSSLSIIGRTSSADSNRSAPPVAAVRESVVPSVVVQDEEVQGGSAKSRRSLEQLSGLGIQTPSRELQRVGTFKGIQSDISSGGLGDFDLGDLATNKIAFSHRGSLLYRGKKMNERPIRQNDGDGQSKEDLPAPDAQPAQTKEESPISDNAGEAGPAPARRKPSAQMLQAAIQGGRVLSVEEMTFSERVRSMYEHGDERAVSWTSPQQDSSTVSEVSESPRVGTSTPDPSTDNIAVGKTRGKPSNDRTFLRSPTPNTLANFNKEPTELAGGIEDWDDIEGRDVDRYGFINPKRVISRPSTAEPAPGGGVHRVATSLRVESDRPRRQGKLKRQVSSAARSSNSLPGTTRRNATNRVASVHSVQTHKSIVNLPAANPFRSKDRKALAVASDMLTLPPGLADIAEHEDAGRTASALKQREWTREEKWQNMARLTPQHDRSTGKGGGMRFEFDTNDPKLISRTWKGIPDRWRATAWHNFLSASAKKRGIGASDDELALQFHKLQEENSPDDVQIDMDVPRTINMHIMFRRRYRGGQRLLFRMLHAVSLYFPETGYVQGMASLAATFLCYFDEERAFVMMVRLWQLRGLEQLFQSGFGGLMKALEEFEKDWLKQGDVAQKLEQLGITSTAYGTRWYLTLFNMSMPFPAQLRVWDVFMLLGDGASSKNESNDDGGFGGADLDVLHATSAALIDATREIVLDSDFENAMKVLTSFVPIKDVDLLMRVTRAEWKMRKKRGGKA